MATIKDLRELVNVSRLEYREADDEYDFSDDEHKKLATKNTRQYQPKPSRLEPIKSTSAKSNQSLLLDRNSMPSVDKDDDLSQSIEPLKMANNGSILGADNFDDMLTFIDASVVGEWLNRANRILKKMSKWYDQSDAFILFCNFWLGGSAKDDDGNNNKMNDKQRRQLIEMEYSIVCDEVTQAFQVGLEGAQLTVSDIYRLLKSVLREYPLHLLSFRGTYMLLEYIETLSGSRDDVRFKQLLSDVKCRTLNRQCAQWLLSIRSFALINMCWSMVNFYRKTKLKSAAVEPPSSSRTTNKTPQSRLEMLNGRISSLSMAATAPAESTSSSSSDEESQQASSSSSSSAASSSNKSSAKRTTGLSSKMLPLVSASVSSLAHSIACKYDQFLQSVLKFDFPEVLHYLITTKKCDPYQKDEHNRTLVFLAVMYDKPKILSYLIKRWPSIDVNEPCDNGNTPLHAAVNKGKLDLVELLLLALNNNTEDDDLVDVSASLASFVASKPKYRLDINRINERCMNATALHLAVWNEHNEIALRLLRVGADAFMKMNSTQTALDLALESSNQVLYELMQENSNNNKK